MKRQLTGSAVVCALLSATLLAVLWAHEGHKAITAKGITTDEKGRMVIDAAAAKAIGVALTRVDFLDIEQTVKLNTRIVLPWKGKAYASARIEGVVKRILVQPGQAVKRGDPLALVESLPLEGLRLSLAQAEIELSLAEKNLKRVRELGEGVIAGREILDHEILRDGRKFRITTLRRKLRAVGETTAGDVLVVAPIAGNVVRIDALVGAHVTPEKRLFVIHDLREVWAQCEVPEDLVGRVALHQPAGVRLFAYPERRFMGQVDLAGFSIDPKSHVRHVWVRLKNPQALLVPGMHGSATIVIARSAGAFAVSEDAIVTAGAERYAFVQVKPGVFEKKNLILGARAGGFVEIKEGLYPGDQVITDGNHELASLFVEGTLKVSPEARRNIGLETEELQLRIVERILAANAQVVSPPGQRGVISARMEGKIARILVLLGQQLKVGTPLVELESLELQNVQLDMIQARLNRQLVRKQLGYLDRLAQGISARKAVLRLRSKVQEAESRFQSFRRRLLLLGLTASQLAKVLETGNPVPTVTVRSRMRGVVTEIQVVLGQVVDQGELLVEVVDLSKVWIEGAFFESDIARLTQGEAAKAVTFRSIAYPERRRTGKIGLVNRTLEGTVGVLKAWVEVDNKDGQLLPGMQASMAVTLARPSQKVIAVPLRALLRIGRRWYAFVKQGKGFRRVAVQLGRRDADHAEAIRGLYPGDQVVVAGVNEMNNAFSAVR